MVNYEIGWTQYWMKGILKTELVGFISDGNNLIVMVPPAPPPPPQYRNSGSFNNKGLEFSVNCKPGEKVSLHANYTYIHMKEPLPATPEHNLFLSGNLQQGKFSFNLKLQNIFNLYNETNGGVGVVEKSYHVLGARLGYQVSRSLRIYLSGHNLLNQEYQINYGYPMPGLTVFGGIDLKLERDAKP